MEKNNQIPTSQEKIIKKTLQDYFSPKYKQQENKNIQQNQEEQQNVQRQLIFNNHQQDQQQQIDEQKESVNVQQQFQQNNEQQQNVKKSKKLQKQNKSQKKKQNIIEQQSQFHQQQQPSNNQNDQGQLKFFVKKQINHDDSQYSQILKVCLEDRKLATISFTQDIFLEYKNLIFINTTYTIKNIKINNNNTKFITCPTTKIEKIYDYKFNYEFQIQNEQYQIDKNYDLQGQYCYGQLDGDQIKGVIKNIQNNELIKIKLGDGLHKLALLQDELYCFSNMTYTKKKKEDQYYFVSSKSSYIKLYSLRKFYFDAQNHLLDQQMNQEYYYIDNNKPQQKQVSFEVQIRLFQNNLDQQILELTYINNYPKVKEQQIKKKEIELSQYQNKSKKEQNDFIKELFCEREKSVDPENIRVYFEKFILSFSTLNKKY